MNEYSFSNFHSLQIKLINNLGTLEVRLMGCQDLLEEVPGRSKRDRDYSSSPTDLRTFMKGVTGRGSSKSYTVKDELSNEIMAVIRLDNQTVAQTNWKPCSQQAWDQRYNTKQRVR